MSPFDYLKAINETKENVMLTPQDERKYLAFIVNRGLSFFMDTIFQVNEMNRNHHLDSRLQFDYFLNTIRKKKRYSKWLKPETLQDLEVIKEYYGFSNEKAKNTLKILSSDQLSYIKDKLKQGGVEK
jgi:hypothetical protein|tara:strand:+ start:2478 stop:2858 length:381 start_codon:yes stop_codon:yes gene_type:complete